MHSGVSDEIIEAFWGIIRRLSKEQPYSIATLFFEINTFQIPKILSFGRQDTVFSLLATDFYLIKLCLS